MAMGQISTIFQSFDFGFSIRTIVAVVVIIVVVSVVVLAEKLILR